MIIRPNLREFWHRFQFGIEVVVGSSQPDTLLGVRDGFLRYFHDGLERPIPVAVHSQPAMENSSLLPLSEEETLATATRGARQLQSADAGSYHFYVSAEAGINMLDVEGQSHTFLRIWTVVCGPTGEAWGGSGSLQLPDSLIEGLDGEQIPYAIPGTRRRGGMISSLTGGLETRRSAVAVSTLHALSSLFYGILESRPIRGRPGRRSPLGV